MIKSQVRTAAEDQAALNEARAEKRIIPWRIFRNFGFLTTGRVIGDASMFLLFVILSRTFGQEGIGHYSFAMAFTSFFAVFSEYGLYHLTIKELNRRIESSTLYYSWIISLRVVLSAAVLAILMLTIQLLPFSGQVKLIILLIGAYQLLQKLVEGFTTVFVAHEKTHLACFLDASFKLVSALGGVGVVVASGSLTLAVSVLPAITSVQLVVAYWLVAKRYCPPRLVVSPAPLIRVAREATPYAVSVLLFQIYTRTDVVMLGLFLSAAAAGVYNVAYRIVFLLSFIPALVGIALFPQASRLYTTTAKEFETLYHKALNAAVLIGLPVASGLWLIAPKLIGPIYGEAFSESASILRILSWMVFPAFLIRIMEVFLMSSDQQVVATKSHFMAACLNVTGNLALIPTLGIKGAAIASLLSQGLLMVLFAMRLKVHVGLPRVSSRMLMGGLGATVFCVPFALLPALSLLVVMPASVFLYSTTLLLFKDIRRNEVRMLVSLLRWGT